MSQGLTEMLRVSREEVGQLRKRLTTLCLENAELRRGYTAAGVEGWGCPGCKREDGKLIELCGLHKQIAAAKEI